MGSLDRFLPEFEVAERHSIEIGRPPEQVMRSLAELRVEEMPLARLLFLLRALPARLTGRPSAGGRPASVLERFRRGGAIVLAEEPGKEMVLGLVGRFWRLGGGDHPPRLHDAGEFMRFEAPGYAKAVVNFEVSERDGVTTLVTETRVRTIDAASRQAFRRYWRIIGPGSALTRRSALAAVRRRAEAAVR